MSTAIAIPKREKLGEIAQLASKTDPKLMVTTKYCCWGECKSDVRYPYKWPKSLKKVEQSGKKVFIPFPKPTQDTAKCVQALASCLFAGFLYREKHNQCKKESR